MGVADKQRTISVEVVYATPDEQARVAVEVDDGATLREAIERSGLLARFPEIDLERCKTGVYGKPATLARRLRERDRVEIYRALRVNPKEGRRLRARAAATRRKPRAQ
ncbi:MAG: RnfH family protein [Gammaproteobacteria bacterium]